MTIEVGVQLPSEDASDVEHRSFARRSLDFVFGYDFFISYSWSDGATYSAALARRLVAEGFEVFLDRDDYASGDDWKKVGAWTLRRTGQLVLVGSPNAIESHPVIREIEIFSKTGRRIVPIDFAGTTDWKKYDSPLAQYLPTELLRIMEPAAALDAGPSDETVATIRRTFKLVRQEKKRLRAFGVIALLLGALAVAATWQWQSAIAQRNRAEQETNRARKNLSSALTALAFTELDLRPMNTAKLALAAWPRREAMDLPKREMTLNAVARSLAGLHERIERSRVTTNGRIRSVGFSPDGRRVLTGFEDSTASMWDVGTGKELLTYKGHEGSVTSIAFSPDGARVLTGSDDKTARLWDAATGKEIRVFKGHGDICQFRRFQPQWRARADRIR